MLALWIIGSKFVDLYFGASPYAMYIIAHALPLFAEPSRPGPIFYHAADSFDCRLPRIQSPHRGRTCATAGTLEATAVPASDVAAAVVAPCHPSLLL